MTILICRQYRTGLIHLLSLTRDTDVKVIRERFAHLDLDDIRLRMVRAALITADCSKSAIANIVNYVVTEGESKSSVSSCRSRGLKRERNRERGERERNTGKTGLYLPAGSEGLRERETEKGERERNTGKRGLYLPAGSEGLRERERNRERGEREEYGKKRSVSSCRFRGLKRERNRERGEGGREREEYGKKRSVSSCRSRRGKRERNREKGGGGGGGGGRERGIREKEVCVFVQVQRA